MPALALNVLGKRRSLNSISQRELASLPGIGKKAAQAVVERRQRQPFRSWEDVERVRGIGPARLAVLMELTEIDAPDAGLW